MSEATLGLAVQDYLRLRRSFGYVLAGQDRPLADFARYLDRIGLETVTVEAALAWAVEPKASRLRHYQRLAMVRGFATYLQAIDSRCEVPARELLREGRRRVPPHIYSTEEIAGLMRHSRDLRPPFRAMTIETAIGLLAVTGMRSGEVVAGLGSSTIKRKPAFPGGMVGRCKTHAALLASWRPALRANSATAVITSVRLLLVAREMPRRSSPS